MHNSPFQVKTGIELQKQKPVEIWVFTVEMDAAVSDETNLRF